jgi:hypothetical protein
VIVVDVLDLQWLAGLLEGEGSFLRAVPSSPRCPSIRLEMCDRDVVDRSARLLKRAVIPITPRQPKHRRSYVTTIKGQPAIRLMMELAPLMSDVRRRQIRRAVRGLASTHLPARAWTPTVHWLAGLLEGEGTFTAKGIRGSWVTISVEMCDRATVRRVADILGATAIWRDAGDPGRGWQPTYITKVSGNRARPWMATVHPFMSKRRQAAIDRALASWTPTRLWPAPADCIVRDCGRPHRARGLCHVHYMRWSRYRAVGKDPGFQPLR